MVFFTFVGSDEVDEISSSGPAELTEDGGLEIEIAFHLGDDAVLKAIRKSRLQRPASAVSWLKG